MIKKLELKNFKGYEFENFIFEKFNLLTGTNSSGKSTIIQALELFEFTNEDNIRKFPSRKKNEVSIINLTQDKDCHFIGFNELKRRRSLTSISEIDEDNDKFSIEIDGVKKVYDEVSFFDERVKKIAKEKGYQFGLAVEQQFYNPEKNYLFQIPRVELYQEPWWKVQMRMKGFYSAIKKIQG